MVEKIASERKVLHGIGVSNGLGWGRARVMAIAPLKLPQYPIKEDQIKSELQRLQKAITGVNRELTAMLKRTPKKAPKELKSFLEMFRMLINDETLYEEVERIVRDRLINVEWALAIHLEEVKSVFENMTDSYLSERGDDIEHAVNRLQQELAGVSRKMPEEKETEANVPQDEVVLVTSDLSLADVIWLTQYEDLDLVGIITEKGGPTSHTAVLSQTLFIPAVVGVTGARGQIKNGEIIFIDAAQGTIICNPTEQEIIDIAKKIQVEEDQAARFAKSRRTKAITKDRHKVKLMANVAMVAGLDDVLEQGAEGIGLYRSEYLFMGRDRLPDEEEQYLSYKNLIDSMDGREVIIRTLDVGGDKLLNATAKVGNTVAATFEDETNPALGLRAIRFSMANPNLFLTQLKAIMRAAYKENVKIMLPMISSVEEIKEAKRYIKAAKSQLIAEKMEFNPDIPLGIMVEVPAVALRPLDYLSEVTFGSIGTNDLIQYTLAVDRGNPTVAPLYDEFNPSVLQLIANVAKAGDELKMKISICGEMGGKRLLIPFFVGIGLTELSMAAMQIPIAKRLIRHIKKADCEKLAENVLSLKTGKEVKERLEVFLEKVRTDAIAQAMAKAS